MQSSSTTTQLYSFTKPYIEIINEFLRTSFGIPVAGEHQGALYAFAVAEEIPDAAFLYLVNHKRLLGDSMITVSNITPEHHTKLRSLVAKSRSKDKTLVASAIVVATALSIQNNNKLVTAKKE